MYVNDKELLQRVADSYEAVDILEILDLTYNLDNEDIFDMDSEDVVKVYKKKILENIDVFNVK